MILDAGIEIERRHLCPSAHRLKDHHDLTRQTFPWAVPTRKVFQVKGVCKHRCVPTEYNTKVEGTDVQPLPHITTPLALSSTPCCFFFKTIH